MPPQINLGMAWGSGMAREGVCKARHSNNSNNHRSGPAHLTHFTSFVKSSGQYLKKGAPNKHGAVGALFQGSVPVYWAFWGLTEAPSSQPAPPNMADCRRHELVQCPSTQNHCHTSVCSTHPVSDLLLTSVRPPAHQVVATPAGSPTPHTQYSLRATTLPMCAPEGKQQRTQK